MSALRKLAAAFAMAVCPCCGDQRAFRDRCDLCCGAGYVPRSTRNAWKQDR